MDEYRGPPHQYRQNGFHLPGGFVLAPILDCGSCLMPRCILVLIFFCIALFVLFPIQFSIQFTYLLRDAMREHEEGGDNSVYMGCLWGPNLGQSCYI